jgi:hypothetical protein
VLKTAKSISRTLAREIAAKRAVLFQLDFNIIE